MDLARWVRASNEWTAFDATLPASSCVFSFVIILLVSESSLVWYFGPVYADARLGVVSVCTHAIRPTASMLSYDSLIFGRPMYMQVLSPGQVHATLGPILEGGPVCRGSLLEDWRNRQGGRRGSLFGSAFKGVRREGFVVVT